MAILHLPFLGRRKKTSPLTEFFVEIKRVVGENIFYFCEKHRFPSTQTNTKRFPL